MLDDRHCPIIASLSLALLLLSCFSGWNNPPNIVLISLDTLRPDHLDLYGYERKTAQNLSKVAQRSILFTEAYSTSSFTLPAHGTIFTGLQPREHGLIDWQSKLGNHCPSLTEELKEAGYFCAAFVVSPPLLAEYGFSRGFDLYDDYSHSMDILQVVPGAKVHDEHPQRRVTGQNITFAAVNWLRNMEEEPFFLFLHYFDIHADYIPPGRYRQLFDPEYEGHIDGRISDPWNEAYYMDLADRDLAHLIALYDGEIAWVDYNVGAFLEELERQGLQDRTAVVIFSDHGEGFGEHGLYGHENSLYDELTRVALLIQSPADIREAKVVNTPVSLIQCRETLRYLAGLPKHDKTIPTLLEMSANDLAGMDWVISGSLDRNDSLVFVRMGDWKIIHNEKSGGFELYNLDTDPLERENVASKRLETVDRLWQYRPERLSIVPSSNVVDEKSPTADRIEQLKALGYNR